MSTTQVISQEYSDQYTYLYCGYAVFALLVYDWLLCLDHEARLIWNWHSRVAGSSLVYAFSRYAVLLSNFLSLLTSYPLSDSKQMAGWHNYTFGPPTASNDNLFQVRCRPHSLQVNLVTRGSQLMAELLVVAITWWYTYQSYHIWKDSIKIGKSLSSLLIYNGSMYFLFFSTWYIIDIIFNTAPVSPEALNVDSLLLTVFYDPITSILVCRFILSLRQFDTRSTSTTYSRPDSSRLRRSMTTTHALNFAVNSSDTLPSFLASFSHPVHVQLPELSDTDVDFGIIFDNWPELRETDMMLLTLDNGPDASSRS
ncbi:hypothetical protein V8D89_001285 [Ganoderma adspersum]